jgi:hypothetical protein
MQLLLLCANTMHQLAPRVEAGATFRRSANPHSGSPETINAGIVLAKKIDVRFFRYPSSAISARTGRDVAT